MGLLRSEFMTQGVLLLPRQDARKYIDLLGRKAKLQFEDMNSDHMRRPYRKYIQRIDEMERILRFVLSEIAKLDDNYIERNCVEEFLALDCDAYKLDDIELDLSKLYKDLVKSTENNSKMIEERNQVREEIQVVTRAITLLKGSKTGANLSDSLLDPFERRVNQVSGVVSAADEQRLRLALFRASRGNAFTDFYPIAEPLVDPKTGLPVQKSVFVVYFQGAGGFSAPMHQKITKVCQAVGVNIYGWPADESSANASKVNLSQLLLEKDQALNAYNKFHQYEMDRMLAPARPGANSLIEEYSLFLLKEKTIYDIMNMCNEHDVILRTSVWYPTAEQKQLEELLEGAAQEWGCQPAGIHAKKVSSATPPTYIRTNEYTQGWQDVINTYGIPRYQEANPGLLTIVTFPFIFGMMYGDIGHGSLLLLTGLYLVNFGEPLRYTMPAVFNARFIVLSLGFFATFAGTMYNDFFSIGLPIFETRYNCPEPATGEMCTAKDSFDPTNSVGGGGPYPWGLDWAWHGAGNELLFVNSLKMKLSVLFGVLQMIVGVLLRWGNAAYEKNKTDFCFECVPMMVFMLTFFGWMDWLVLYKWVHPTADAPSIINSLICMAMGQEDKNPMYEGSVEQSKTGFLFTLASVPLMLFFKPFILLSMHNAQKKKEGDFIELDDEAAAGGGHGHGHGEEFEFGEVFIHQIIETIEYVLGTVSHTASYLRIWALSLAHQQLSLVFFQKTLANGLAYTGSPAVGGLLLYIMFACWFGVTLAVLLGMDVLECFLHTLRLHWVEFQSKFYRADGYLFEPFSVQKLVLDAADN